MKGILMVIFSVGVMASFAGGWRLTLGPAWRARVKSSISGSGAAPAGTPSTTVTSDRDIDGHGEWSVGEVEQVQDPDYPDDPAFKKYAATRTLATTTVTPGGGELSRDGSEVDRPLGLRAIVGCDFYETSCFSFGLGVKFASYWNMRSTASGSSGGGTVNVHKTKDYYLFSNGPIPDDTDFTSFTPDADPYLPYQENEDLPSAQVAGEVVHARIRSDLYQLGLGPQMTWHVCDRLDFYGRAEALCNLVHMSFDVGSETGTDTKCLLGFGGTLGCSVGLTENLGLYAEAGYEWVDKAETDLGRAKAKVDYSSLVVSTGMIWRF